MNELIQALETLKTFKDKVTVEHVLSSLNFYVKSAHQIRKDLRTEVPKVLDVGCSYGYGVSILHEICPFCRIVGVDINESAIRFAEKRIQNKNISFETADLTKKEDALTLIEKFEKYGKFDAITCFEVFEHIPPDKSGQLLDNLRLLLKPNGLLFISTPNSHVYDVDAFTFDHINEIEYEEFTRILKEYDFEPIKIMGSRRVNPTFIRVVYRFGLEARKNNKINQLPIHKRVLRLGLACIFEPRRLLFFILKKISYKKYLKFRLNTECLNETPQWSSLIYVIAKKVSRT